MTVTYCLGGFARALARAPHTESAWRGLVAQQPKACPREGCTAGGCRKHCADYASVQWQALERKEALESAKQMARQSKGRRR